MGDVGCREWGQWEERTAAYVCIYLKVVLGVMREGVVEEVERWGMERLQHRSNVDYFQDFSK